MRALETAGHLTLWVGVKGHHRHNSSADRHTEAITLSLQAVPTGMLPVGTVLLSSISNRYKFQENERTLSARDPLPTPILRLSRLATSRLANSPW